MSFARFYNSLEISSLYDVLMNENLSFCMEIVDSKLKFMEKFGCFQKLLNKEFCKFYYKDNGGIIKRFNKEKFYDQNLDFNIIKKMFLKVKPSEKLTDEIYLKDYTESLKFKRLVLNHLKETNSY